MKVLVIGGSVIDIFGYPHQKMIMHDSNPGYLVKSLGGVGRNIAENLCRLNIDCELISIIGKDSNGKMILDHASSINLKIHPIFSDETPIYLCLMDEHNEDLISLAVMDQNSLLTIDEIQKKDKIIKDADMIVLDTNFDVNVLEYILNTYQKPIFVDAISSQKVVKIKPYLSKITAIKLNIIEASILTNISYIDLESVEKMGKYLINEGVKEVYITLGNQGAYLISNKDTMYKRSINIKVINSTGAGDAFFAGVIYGKIKQLNPLSTGIANSIINLQDEKAVSSKLTEDLLIQTLKEHQI
jgi:pseudouridine kinase